MRKFFFAQKAFIVHDRKLLLVQKSLDDPHNPGKWEVPGGRMDFGEDVDEHIKREVKEEVGLDIEPGTPFYVWQWQLERHSEDGERLEIQIAAVARLCTPLSLKLDTGRRVDEDYLGEIRWVDYLRVKHYDLISNMIPVVDRFLAMPEVQSEGSQIH